MLLRNAWIPFAVVVLSGASLTPAARSESATHPQWGSLKAGPHAVGFRVTESFDRTRLFKAPVAADGARARGETARPMQIAIWYPAQASPGAPAPLRYRSYVHLRASEIEFSQPSQARLHAAEESQRASWGRREALGEDELSRILDTPTAAIADARPAEGRFPVILVAPHPPLSNSVLFEYLASHGFVVATIGAKGRKSAEFIDFTPNPVAIDTLVRDIEFLRAHVASSPNVDIDRLGLWAFSSYSIYTTLFQMRQLAARAVVHVEGWEGFARGLEVLDEATYFDPDAIRVPYLLIKKAKQESSPRFATTRTYFESLRFAPRTLVELRDADHADFMFRAHVRGSDPVKRPLYDAACRMAREFFEAHLRSTGEARAPTLIAASQLPAEALELTHLPAKAARPTETEWVRLFELGHDGIARARQLHRAATEADPDGTPTLSEARLNRIGYRLLGDGSIDAAIAAFRLNVETYPDSANAYDSLSDGLESSGELRQALQLVREALERTPRDPKLSDEERESLREHLLDKRERLTNLAEAPETTD